MTPERKKEPTNTKRIEGLWLYTIHMPDCSQFECSCGLDEAYQKALDAVDALEKRVKELEEMLPCPSCWNNVEPVTCSEHME